jgi:hypothetical protein
MGYPSLSPKRANSALGSCLLWVIITHLVRVDPEVPPLHDEAIHPIIDCPALWWPSRQSPHAQSHVDPAILSRRRATRSEIDGFERPHGQGCSSER